MAPKQGILYVTMNPKSSLSLARFNDWYMNEHGPMRLRMPQIFRNGFRYRAIDLYEGGRGLPEWMAVYDVTDTAELVKEPYIAMRRPPFQSEREKDIKDLIDIDRSFYDLLQEWKRDDWTPLEDTKNEGTVRVMLSFSFALNEGVSPIEIDKWYREEHVSMLAKVPGWVRTRRFVSSATSAPEDVRYMALHEFEEENGLGGPEFKTAITTDWSKEVFSTLIKGRHVRKYTLHYTFTQAPRDLMSLTAPDVEPFVSTDGRTQTYKGSDCYGWPAIESYITTRDDVQLAYRLEGAWHPNAPLILLSNCILSTWGIWDEFVKAFLAKEENQNYRILRYNTRGRDSRFGTQPINIDVLAKDIIDLLDALRVPKAAALIGVSMGGCTVLNTAMKHFDRTSSILVSDSSWAAAPGNQKAWEERLWVAEKQSAVNEDDESIVGSDLAELTVRRWFTPKSYEVPSKVEQIERVRAMVESNSLQGFKASVPTLYAYDLTEASLNSAVKAKFVVGAEDGVLPPVLDRMSKEYGSRVGTRATFNKIEAAGHLPMVENCEDFLDAVESFLKST